LSPLREAAARYHSVLPKFIQKRISRKVARSLTLLLLYFARKWKSENLKACGNVAENVLAENQTAK